MQLAVTNLQTQKTKCLERKFAKISLKITQIIDRHLDNYESERRKFSKMFSSI